jgi:hypothetical protein
MKAHDAFNDAVSTAQMYLILQDLKARGLYLKRTQARTPPMMPMG